MMSVLWNNRRLVWDLSVRDLRESYIGSAGDWAWLIIKPLFTVLAYIFVFDLVFQARLGGDAGTRHFGVYLLAGLIPWMAFSEGLTRGTNSLVAAGALLKKTALPLEIFPARAALASAMVYLPVILLLAAGLLVARASVHWSLLLLPVWFVLQVMLTYSLGLVLALMTAALRDVSQMVGLVVSVGIFFAPIFYPLERVPELFRAVLWLNPATPLVLGYQSLLLRVEPPSWSVIVGLLAWVMVAATFAALLLRRSREQVVDWL